MITALSLALLFGLLASPALLCEKAGAKSVVEYATCLEIVIEARARGLDEHLVVSLAWHESHFDPSAVSRKGAVGPLQALPRWWCPGGRIEGCDLIEAGLDALEAFLEMAEGDPEQGICFYNSGNSCLPRGERYARSVVKKARRLKQSLL